MSMAPRMLLVAVHMTILVCSTAIPQNQHDLLRGKLRTTSST